jgi:hypothetical protein
LLALQGKNLYAEYREVWNELIAPGADFEIAVVDILGNPTRTYANAPATCEMFF